MSHLKLHKIDCKLAKTRYDYCPSQSTDSVALLFNGDPYCHKLMYSANPLRNAALILLLAISVMVFAGPTSMIVDRIRSVH